MPADGPQYRRVLLKLSGESPDGRSGLRHRIREGDHHRREIAEVARLGTQVCIVVGGGNIFRGLSGAAKGMERATADYMGMLATVMNSLALQNALGKAGGADPGPIGDPRCRRCASPISAGARCAIWKRDGW